MMRTVYLVHIATVDFRSSEATLFDKLCKRQPHLRNLGAEDAILFRSRSGTQLCFILGKKVVATTRGERVYVRSERLRLEGHTPWNPFMLAEYASQCGIKLDGVLTFEQHLNRITKRVNKRLGVGT